MIPSFWLILLLNCEVHSLVNDFHKYIESVVVQVRPCLNLVCQKVKGADWNVPQGGEGMLGEHKGYRVHRHLSSCRGDEVGVGVDNAVRLVETGRTLNLFGLGPALNGSSEKRLGSPLFLSCRVQEIYPESVFFADSSKLRFGL